MVLRMLGDVLKTPLGQGFALAQVARARTRAEFAFNLASFQVPSLSIDDDYPGELLWVASGWFSTAVMAWRELT